jgi:hypothetical protein
MGFISGAHVGLQRQPFLNHTRIMNGGVFLLEVDYTVGIKHSYRRHHYILQYVLILKAVQVTYPMEHSSPFIGYPSLTENGHTATACAGRHILRVVTLFPRPVN